MSEESVEISLRNGCSDVQAEIPSIAGPRGSFADLRATILSLKKEFSNFSDEVSQLGARSHEAITELQTKTREVANASKVAFGPNVTDEGIVWYQGRPFDDERNGLYGNFLWSSAVAMSKFCCWMDTDQSLKGKRVLELGSGTGVVGLTLAKLGAMVTLTDGEPQVLSLLQRNIEANVSCTASQQLLRFGDPQTYVPQNNFQLIVAADVIYNGTDQTGTSLMETIEAHMLVDSTTEVWIAYEHRPDAPLRFFSLLVEKGLRVERLEDTQGNAAAAGVGQEPSIYIGCQFVGMCSDDIPEAIRHARYSAWNAKHIQLFRISTRLPGSQRTSHSELGLAGGGHSANTGAVSLYSMD